MAKIRIIKKNNDCSMEYEVGDICEVTGTWYGGVHINGRSGIPVSLDKEEYMELNTEPEEPDSAENENTLETPEHDIHAGDIVQHFKREWVSPDTSEYLYKVLAVAHHTENGEKLMIYQALYAPFKICARPYDMFMSEVDRDKYPDIKQKYRFEKYTEKPVIVRESLKDALAFVREHQEGRKIYCLGSLYLTGMIKDLLSHA